MSRMNQIGKTATSVYTEKGTTRVVYHNTAVVSFNEKSITLACDGWFTRTTLARMNQASNQYGLGFSVVQRQGKWIIRRNGGLKETLFHDGIVLKRGI